MMIISIKHSKGVLAALSALTFSLFAAMANAQPTDFGSCVAKNKQFGGATAACAEDICNWEVCKDQIIYSTGSTGLVPGAPLASNRNAGEEGSALAVCMPKQQIMDRCLASEVRAAAKPPEPPKPPWCKTGSDADLPTIRVKYNALSAQINTLTAALKPLQQRYEKHGQDMEDAKSAYEPMKTAFKAAKARAQTDEDYRSTYKSNWIYSGKLDLLNELIDAYNEQNNYQIELWPDIERLQDQRTALKEKRKSIGRDMLDRDRNCAGALAALQ